MTFEDGKSYDLKNQGPYFDLWFEMIEHYLDSCLPEKGLLLDAGGGTGEFTIRAANLRGELLCENLDISQKMLDQADWKIKENGLHRRVSTKLGDIQNLPYSSGHFDFVMCLGDAISFCQDVWLAFSEIVRVTKPNCLIYLSVNSFWNNYYAMYSQGSEKGLQFEDVKKYMHTRILHINGKSTGCRSFTMAELDSLADKHNLSIERKFAAPVFSTPDDWLTDETVVQEIRELQYNYCENENIMEFGNDLNVIYRKR